MASATTQTIEVVERPAEQVEKPAKPRFSSPRRAPKDTRWVIKLSGTVPG